MESAVDTQLLIAWASNDEQGIITALRAGASPSAKRDGVSLLLAASMAGNVQLVRTLLDAGADINTRNHHTGTTALMYVAAVGAGPSQHLVLRELLARGAQVNARDIHGNTALDLAISYGETTNVLALRAAGASRSSHVLSPEASQSPDGSNRSRGR